MTTIKFEKLRGVESPSRSYDAAAGWDFYIPNSFKFVTPHHLTKFTHHEEWESKVIPSRRAIFIPSGIRLEMEKGWAMKFENKSGIAIRGLLVGACIIDQDYQGEVHLHLWNVSQDDIVVKAGMKIVQGIFFKTYDIELQESKGLFTNTTTRGQNGFGSSQKVH